MRIRRIIRNIKPALRRAFDDIELGIEMAGEFYEGFLNLRDSVDGEREPDHDKNVKTFTFIDQFRSREIYENSLRGRSVNSRTWISRAFWRGRADYHLQIQESETGGPDSGMMN